MSAWAGIIYSKTMVLVIKFSTFTANFKETNQDVRTDRALLKLRQIPKLKLMPSMTRKIMICAWVLLVVGSTQICGDALTFWKDIAQITHTQHVSKLHSLKLRLMLKLIPKAARKNRVM